MTDDEISEKLKLISANRSSDFENNKSKTEKKEFKSGQYEEETLDELHQKRYKQNTNLRKKLAYWAASVVSLWLSFVAYVLFENSSLSLSDSVLMMLLGTTTIQVLGIVMVVVRDIFNGRSEDKI